MIKLISKIPKWYRHINLRKKCNATKTCDITSTAIIFNSSGDKNKIKIGHKSQISGILIVWNNSGKIEIGDYSYVGENTRIISASRIKIGDRVQIAHGCNIFDNNIHSLDPKERHEEFITNTTKGLIKINNLNEMPLTIMNDAWIGANTIILKGVTIGKGAIIGAGSVVLHDIPDYAVAVGNPAQVIKLLPPSDIT